MTRLSSTPIEPCGAAQTLLPFLPGDDLFGRMNGSDLLKNYRASASDDAFAELVRRYTNLVFSVARRRLNNTVLAEDATQTVFTRLAQSAPGLNTDPELVAWLHRTTVHVAIDLWRSETRRQTREQKAAMELTEADSAQLWQELTPHLDEALNELDDVERQAVLLRFFQSKSMREIGQSFGVSEDAAKMRVSRALERLRTQLVPRGVACSVAVLGTLVAERSVEAAPAGLIPRLISISRPALPVAKGTVPISHLPIGKLQIAGVAALIVGISLLLVRSRHSTPVEIGPDAGQQAATLNQPRSTPFFARRAASGASAPIPPTPEKIHVFLRVLAEDTGRGLEGAQVRAVYFYAGGRGERHILVTDRNGVAAIPEARESGDPGMNVFVSGAGYVPVCFGFGENAPEEYVLKVEPAAIAAGVVVDEQGQPVPGVTLQASRLEDYKDAKPNVDFQTTRVETDADGRWRYPYLPKSYAEAHFDLTCDGYAVTRVVVPMGKPESVNATLVIKSGFAVIGRVSDAQGMPLAGAAVKEFHNYGHRMLTTETDGNGEFKLAGFAGRIAGSIDAQTEIVVELKGMAPQLRKIELLRPTNVANFVLTKGNVFRGRVVDESGQPLVGVACRTDSDNQGRQPFRWFTHTDADGRFEWDSAPAAPTLFWFELDGFNVIRDRLLTPDGSDHEIKLEKKGK